MSVKKLGIMIILVACVVTVAPLLILLLNAMCEGYSSSVLGKLMADLDN